LEVRVAEQQKKQQKANEPETPKEAVKEVDPPEDALEFPVERLIAEGGQFLGHESHVVAGALSGVSRKNLTLEEAEAAVKTWLKSEVKTEA
jgi:hypothetical protein